MGQTRRGSVSRWPVLLALEGELRHAKARPLPDRNELANSCYFTYRVGYIICDTGLGPEEAQREMEAGKCNEDFRLMGSDFQRRVVRHYTAAGPPPLEEAMWLMTAPGNFQLRTLKECPAMQVLAYLLLAEAKLYLQGPSPRGAAADLVRKGLEQAQGVPQDVYSALAKAWPMDLALDRFQSTAYRLRALVDSRNEEPFTFRVDVVVCRCAESLVWLADLVELVPVSGDIQLFSYNTCKEEQHNSAAITKLEPFKAVRFKSAPSHVAGANGECSARGVLAHILDVTTVATPAFTLFLSAKLLEGSERRLLEMVFHSIAQRTLDTDYLSLGLARSAAQAPTPCELAVWRDELGLGLPLGYEGARFAVSGQRIKENPIDSYHSLLALLDAPPTPCSKGNDAGADIVNRMLSSAWHVVFGEDIRLPIRADNEQLPVFLRFADGPSGFHNTRMPKTSTYLNGVQIG